MRHTEELREAVLDSLEQAPASAGDLILRLRREGRLPARGGALVYAAVCDLHRRGTIQVLAEGPGERIWSVPGAAVRQPRDAGDPNTFVLGVREMARVRADVDRLTRGLHASTYSELLRVVVAGADRRAHAGATPSDAVRAELEDLGHPAAVRRLLAEAAAGRVAALKRPWLPRLLPYAVVLAVLVAIRLFVLGIYSVPTESMAPTLFPAGEGGDDRILVNQLAYLFGSPERGDVVVFQHRGGIPFVKRIMGLPGEVIGFSGGDVTIDGKALIKDRLLLDRVRVPLRERKHFEEVEAGKNMRWVQDRPLLNRFRRPDGTFEDPMGVDARPAREGVLRFRLTFERAPSTLTTELSHGGKSSDWTLVLRTGGSAGGLYQRGKQVAEGAAFRLEVGKTYEIWFTNADRLTRVQIDGREVARVPFRLYGPGGARFALTFEGEARVTGLEVARDQEVELFGLPRTWTLGEDEYFVLGDNASRSNDSRNFGAVRGGQIEGKVFAVVWPLSRFRWID